MQKKTYMKPLVSLYAIEALTILADSTPPHPLNQYKTQAFKSKEV